MAEEAVQVEVVEEVHRGSLVQPRASFPSRRLLTLRWLQKDKSINTIMTSKQM